MDYKKLSKVADSRKHSISINIEDLFRDLGEDLAWQVIQTKPFSEYDEGQLLAIYMCLDPDLSFDEWVEVNKD